MKRSKNSETPKKKIKTMKQPLAYGEPQPTDNNNRSVAWPTESLDDQARKARMCLGKICVYQFSRATSEKDAKVFVFPEYATEEALKAVAYVSYLNCNTWTQGYRSVLSEEPLNLIAGNFLDAHQFRFTLLKFDKPAGQDGPTDQEMRIINHAKQFMKQVQGHIKLFNPDGREWSISSVVYGETRPDAIEGKYHRDDHGETDARMLVYGSSEGPGTYFTSGDCVPHREGTRSAVAKDDWEPPEGEEVLINPDVGKAVFFTGNLCHKRGQMTDTPRWHLMFNLKAKEP